MLWEIRVDTWSLPSRDIFFWCHQKYRDKDTNEDQPRTYQTRMGRGTSIKSCVKVALIIDDHLFLFIHRHWWINKISTILIYLMLTQELTKKLIKYFIMGGVVAVTAQNMPNCLMSDRDSIMIGMISSITFAILDLHAPSISQTTKNWLT